MCLSTTLGLTLAQLKQHCVATATLKGNESHSWRSGVSFELTGGDTGKTLEINKNKTGKNEQDGEKPGLCGYVCCILQVPRNSRLCHLEG